mgnify:CR=1 FL=1
MNYKIYKKIITSLTVVLIILSTILDSGGEKYIRNVAMIMVFILAMLQLSRNFSYPGILSYLTLVSLLSVSIMRSIASGVEPVTMVAWILPILSIPIFVVFCRAANITAKHFIASGALFGSVVILLFVGRLTGNPMLMELNELLTSGAAGFFNYKQAFFSDELPVVYFQGTLSLVFIGVLAWGYGRYFVFAIILIALVVAPSRFGVFSVCAFALFYTLLSKLSFRYDRFWLTIICVTAFAFITLLFNNTMARDSSFWLEFDSVRGGHLSSIIEVLNDDPSILLTGAGPGSQFFSSGFGALADNIEISQLELLRKYGIAFIVFVHLFLALLIRRLVTKKRNAEVFALLSHYVVSLSNPALLSIPFLLFLGYLIAQCGLGRFRLSNMKMLDNVDNNRRNEPQIGTSK